MASALIAEIGPVPAGTGRRQPRAVLHQSGAAGASHHGCGSRLMPLSQPQCSSWRAFLKCGNSLRRPHWLADDAVDCEPVSVPNSLLTGKNTGKFTKLCPGRQSFSSRCALLSGTSVRLPLESEQGIYKGGTGKIDSRSGNPSAPFPLHFKSAFLELPDGRGNAFGPQVGADVVDQAGGARQAAHTVHHPNSVIDCRRLMAIGI